MTADTAEELIDNFYQEYGDKFDWMPISFSNKTFRDQAYKEIKKGHALYGKTMYAVAKCGSNDDILFVTVDDNGNDLYVIIHLTYSENNDASYPKYITLGNIHDAVNYFENYMDQL